MLLTMKLFGKTQFSVQTSFLHVLFNLIEIDVNIGRVRGRTFILNTLFSAWLLMGLILTNSYKGLLISYLSVPWEPRQDYNYLEEVKDFEFYSRVSSQLSQEYWNHCLHSRETVKRLNTSCNRYLRAFSDISEYIYLHHIKEGSDYTSGSNHTQAQDLLLKQIFFNRLFIYPKNESNEVFKKLISGHKIAYIGLNTEINEILADIGKEFTGIKCFRGKEKIWDHIKNWQFLKYSYCQPKIELIRLMTSGIYQFWKYWIRDRKYIEFKLKDGQLNSPKPLSLDSNIAFVFVILTFGLVISCTVYFSEIVYYTSKKYNILQSVIVGWRKYSTASLNSISILRWALAGCRELGARFRLF